MKMTLELYDTKYTVEDTKGRNDFDSGELKEIFTRLMVCAGFGPGVIDLQDDDGQYQYVGDDEIIIKKEYLDELEKNSKKG